MCEKYEKCGGVLSPVLSSDFAYEGNAVDAFHRATGRPPAAPLADAAFSCA